MPQGATVGRNGTVIWTVRGKKRTGKLSRTDLFVEDGSVCISYCDSEEAIRTSSDIERNITHFECYAI